STCRAAFSSHRLRRGHTRRRRGPIGPPTGRGPVRFQLSYLSRARPMVTVLVSVLVRCLTVGPFHVASMSQAQTAAHRIVLEKSVFLCTMQHHATWLISRGYMDMKKPPESQVSSGFMSVRRAGNLISYTRMQSPAPYSPKLGKEWPQAAHALGADRPVRVDHFGEAAEMKVGRGHLRHRRGPGADFAAPALDPGRRQAERTGRTDVVILAL